MLFVDSFYAKYCTTSSKYSSRSHTLFKISFLKDFKNITRKRLCWCLFLIQFPYDRDLRHERVNFDFTVLLRTTNSLEYMKKALYYF